MHILDIVDIDAANRAIAHEGDNTFHWLLQGVEKGGARDASTRGHIVLLLLLS